MVNEFFSMAADRKKAPSTGWGRLRGGFFNGLNKGFLRITKTIFVIWLGAVVSAGIAPNPGWGSDREVEAPLFSMNADEQPLIEVIEAISKATGYEITISEDWWNSSVTVTLKDVTITEGLRRLLRGTNYCLIIRESEKRVLVTILEGDVRPSVGSFTTKAKAVDSTQQELPENLEESGLSERELDGRAGPPRRIDDEDIEVIPPERPGERGITMKEFNAAAKRLQMKEKILSIEDIIPPED